MGRSSDEETKNSDRTPTDDDEELGSTTSYTYDSEPQLDLSEGNGRHMRKLSLTTSPGETVTVGTLFRGEYSDSSQPWETDSSHPWETDSSYDLHGTDSTCATRTMLDEPNDPITRQMVLWACGKLFLALLALYVFFLGLDLLGDAFKLFGSGAAADMLRQVKNPIAGVCVGIFATVLVQSSGTSTSIVVALVSTGTLTVRAAIPIIMGANIGTSVTNTLVSVGHIRHKDEFRLAFAGATVHDFYNLLTVAILLPIEVATHFLEFLSSVTAEGVTGGGGKFDSPLAVILNPVTHLLVELNKTAIEENDEENFIEGGVFEDSDLAAWAVGVILLIISLVFLCGGLLSLVKILRTFVSARVQRWLGRYMTGKNSNKWWFGLISMGLGFVLTALTQSSSAITSAFTPLVGIGVISLEQMYPVTLGTNVGSTVTAYLAAVATSTEAGIQLAFAHLYFNLCGIVIWYPEKHMRKVPVFLARQLGDAASTWKWVAPTYVAVVFFALPIGLWGLSLLSPAIFWPIFSVIFLGMALFLLWALHYLAQPEYLYTRVFPHCPKWVRQALSRYDLSELDAPPSPPGSASASMSSVSWDSSDEYSTSSTSTLRHMVSP